MTSNSQHLLSSYPTPDIFLNASYTFNAFNPHIKTMMKTYYHLQVTNKNTETKRLRNVLMVFISIKWKKWAMNLEDSLKNSLYEHSF